VGKSEGANHDPSSTYTAKKGQNLAEREGSGKRKLHVTTHNKNQIDEKERKERKNYKQSSP